MAGLVSFSASGVKKTMPWVGLPFDLAVGSIQAKHRLDFVLLCTSLALGAPFHARLTSVCNPAKAQVEAQVEASGKVDTCNKVHVPEGTLTIPVR